ncbi:MAG: hypothetical protein QM759_06225 [Terricaulis sp.]
MAGGRMYFIVVIGLTLVAPMGAAIAEAHGPAGADFGKWYVFCAVGIRLLLAGARQALQPRFTLKQIFEIDAEDALQIVRELGFANLAMGVLGLTALLDPKLTFAGALAGGIFYGLAGLLHVLSKEKRNATRTTAMLTDLLVFAVLAYYVAVTAPALLPLHA